MNKNSVIKRFLKKLFAFYKEDAELIFVIFGIKIKFKYPAINRLEDICTIPNLKELLKKGTKFPHPIGIVINGNAKIGHNCTIWQNVTIGESCSPNKEYGCPTIGDNVQIFANSVVIGDVQIGDNVLVGAGSVVVKDIPSDTIAAGNPARVVKSRF